MVTAAEITLCVLAFAFMPCMGIAYMIGFSHAKRSMQGE